MLRPIKLRTLRTAFPEGTAVVGAGVIVSGLTTYGYLVLAARAVGPERYGGISALWATTVILALGFFLPIEQEVARAVATRRETGVGARPIIRRAAQIGALLGLFLLVALGAASGIVRRELFDGDGGLVACLAVALVAFWATHLARGVASGSGRFADYGFLLGGEATVRLAGCVVLVAAGVDTVVPYGLVLALAPLVAVGVVTIRRPAGASSGDGPPARSSEVTVALGRLVAASVLAQALVNGPAVAVKALGDAADSAAAGRFLAGMILARVPIFLFAAVGASLLPRLSALVAAGELDEFRALLRRLVGLVTMIGLAATVGAAALGPAALPALFGDGFELDRIDFLLMGAGSGAYLVAMVLAQALISVEAHARVALGWLVGVVVFLVVLANDATLVLRVGIAFAAGAAVAAAALGVLLRRAVDGVSAGAAPLGFVPIAEPPQP